MTKRKVYRKTKDNPFGRMDTSKVYTAIQTIAATVVWVEEDGQRWALLTHSELEDLIIRAKNSGWQVTAESGFFNRRWKLQWAF